MFHLVEYITLNLPTCFVLENVANIESIDEAKAFKVITQTLCEAADEYYNVASQVLDSRDHGIPQSRKRLYWVGIAKKVDKGTFTFPEKIPCMDLEAQRASFQSTCPPYIK